MALRQVLFLSRPLIWARGPMGPHGGSVSQLSRVPKRSCRVIMHTYVRDHLDLVMSAPLRLQEAYNAIELRTAAPAPATVTPATPEKPQKARFKAPGPAATAWGALARAQPDRRNDAASGAEARTDSSDALLALDPS